MSDDRIAAHLDLPGVDAHYVFKRRMALRLLRRPGAPRGHRKANRHGTHGIAGKGFSVPAFDNPAFVELRTLYLSTVRDAGELTNLLVSGENSKKIGARITKGPLRGFPARWRREDPIAVELLRLVVARRERFAIRFSNAPVDEDSTVSIEHPIQKPADAVICPAQVGKTESCATCGLCWHSRRRIAFLQH